MRVKIAIFLLLMTPCLTRAQKTKPNVLRQNLSQARTFIKSKKNYDQAERLMTSLLADSALRSDKRIYTVWLDAVKGQYDQANERLYLKQKQDTAAFFQLARRMFTVAFTLDSIDALPDRKGRVAPEHRQKNAAMLATYRPNLFNAGTWFVRKERWADAYTFLDTYLDCARQPLFHDRHYATTDQRLPEAAYWALYSAYRMGADSLVLLHAPQALQDIAHANYTRQFTAEAWKRLGQQEQYTATLEEGFSASPLYPYFFPRLVDAYIDQGQYERALQLTDQALQLCDTCELFLFAKSSVLLKLKRWEESVAYSEQLIHQNDSLPEPYFNAGTAFVNMAESLPATAANKELQRTYYQKARTYMEYYRLLMPAEQRKWAPVLYRIYLNLNLGRQFDEIDQLLKKQ